MKKGFLITAAVMVAAGLLLWVGAWAAAGFDLSGLDTATYVTNTYAPGEDFDRIGIRSYEADILLKPAADGKCTVVCLEREKVKHRVTAEDGTLTVRAEDDREWYDHLSFAVKPQSVTLYLPRDRYEALVIQGCTGDIHIPDSFAFGQMDLTASTGDVACSASADRLLRIKGSTGDVILKDLQAGEMEIALSTGDILGSALRCGRVNLEVSTGDVELTDLKCTKLYAKGSTGDVKLKKVITTEMLQVKTDTGDVALHACDAWKMEIAASTGDVTFDSCDGGEIQVSTSTGDVTGTLRSDKTFIPKTSTGSVKVPDSTTGGICRITTSTGDIEISVTE